MIALLNSVGTSIAKTNNKNSRSCLTSNRANHPNLKRIILFNYQTLLLTMFISFSGCQKKEEPSKTNAVVTDLAKGYAISTNFDDKTSILKVDISLKDGVHAYANGEKVGRPVRLEIPNKNNWEAIGEADMPKGTVKKLGDLGESLVLTGEIHISQKLKKGSGPGEALLHLQVCTTDICDRPRTHSLKLDFN